MGKDILPYFPNYNPLRKRGEEIFFPSSYLWNAQERIFFSLRKMGKDILPYFPLGEMGKDFFPLFDKREVFSSQGKNILPLKGRLVLPTYLRRS